MSAISTFINKIRTAVYGEEVRGAIADAIEQCYDDVSSPALNTAAFATAIANAYADGFLDIQEKSTIAGMKNQKIIYRYTGNQTGYVNGALYYYDGTKWSPIGSALQVISNSSYMTDQGAIYKYTGSQTGFINGALYYYDGSSWKPILSAKNASESDPLEDVTYAVLPTAKWERGVCGDGFVFSDASNRRSTIPVYVPNDCIIYASSPNSSHNFAIRVYDEDGVTVYNSESWSGQSILYEFTGSGYFSVRIRNKDDSAINETDLSAVTVALLSESALSFSCSNDTATVVAGIFDTDSGRPTTLTNRAMTQLLFCPVGCSGTITLSDSSYLYSTRKYKGNSYLGYTDWSSESSYEIAGGESLAICIRKSDNSTLTPSSITGVKLTITGTPQNQIEDFSVAESFDLLLSDGTWGKAPFFGENQSGIVAGLSPNKANKMTVLYGSGWGDVDALYNERIFPMLFKAGFNPDTGDYSNLSSGQHRLLTPVIEVCGGISIEPNNQKEIAVYGYGEYFEYLGIIENWSTSKIVVSDDDASFIRIVTRYAEIGSAAAGTTSTDGKLEEFKKDIVINRTTSIKKKKATAKFSAIPFNDTKSISYADNKFLTMCATRTAYHDGKIPVTVGWLYRTNEAPFEFYYASGNPEDMRHLFTWDSTITHNGTATPIDYSIGITYEGDILCVARGEKIGSRKNPIIYPHGDYENPVVVDFGSDLKPTSWLQNDGLYSSDEGYFCLGEYTRPSLQTTNIWKVVAPYTNKTNWTVVNTFTLSGSNNTGMKHTHNVDKDPFTGFLYSSTGDDSNGSKFLVSEDDGDTWTVFLEAGDSSGIANIEKYCRQLNFIWTKDYIYWATDSSFLLSAVAGSHCLFRAVRDSDGLLDVSSIETMYTFKDSLPATYHCCLINEPSGLLILNRYDAESSYPVDIFFWDFETETMQNIGTLVALGSDQNGFRCDAVNHYPYYNGNKIVCGYGLSPNNLDIYNNVYVKSVQKYGYMSSDDDIKNKVNNIVIEVEK